jgi:hypothetical protein
VITSLIKSKEITPITSTPNHRLIEDVKDYIENNTIVEGYCDVIQDIQVDRRKSTFILC